MSKLKQDKKTKKFFLEDRPEEAYSLLELLEMFRQTNFQIFQGLQNLNERIEKMEAAKPKIIA